MMKRLFIILLTLVICFSFGFTAYASGEPEQDSANEAVAVTENMSQPRLMVSDFKVEGGSLTPDKTSKVTITFKNYSGTKAVKNIKLTLTEESGDIKPVGTGTKYVDTIYAGGTYTWTVNLTASANAQIGEHAVTVSSEYEDKLYNPYSSSDIIRINVKQRVGFDYSSIQLPKKTYQEDTVTVDFTFINTGKSKIRNSKIDFDIKGLESGGCVFVGEIEAGESASGSANLRVGSEITGETKGKAVITYEDEFAKEYTKTIDLSTKIEEKIVEDTDEDEEEEKKNPLWWVFALAGLAVGGGIGCAIPLIINAGKQRKEDELRL